MRSSFPDGDRRRPINSLWDVPSGLTGQSRRFEVTLQGIPLVVEGVSHVPHGIELIQVDPRFFRQTARPLALACAGRFLHPFWAAVVRRRYEHAECVAVPSRICTTISWAGS